MSKKVLINTIGKVFTDSKFRSKFNLDVDSTLAVIRGLTPKEKEFLKRKRSVIKECTKSLNMSYHGENKRK